jgi:hypothetical protein
MWLKTEQKGEKVRFQLELQRGAPSYNSGEIEGELVLSGDGGIFRDRNESGLCEIAFKFHSKRVDLKQSGDGAGCQFGHGVVAEGTLSLKSRKKPKFSAQ